MRRIKTVTGNRPLKRPRRPIVLMIALALLNAGVALAQSTAFTYQGKLTDNGNPATGFFDLSFKLFDSPTVGSGSQQGATVALSNVAVSNGTFSVQLDFGACQSCFDGLNRFLEIGIKPAGASTFTTLEPRQALTASPYAIKSLSAAVADGLSVTCVNCVTSSQIASVNGSAVNGAIPVASVPSGSGSYIQNTTTEQGAANFNISGNGTAGGTLSGDTVNTQTQYNLGGNRILSAPGDANLFVGRRAGAVNMGNQNVFLGEGAGASNTLGCCNSFVGASSSTGTGFSNTIGSFNSFFGYRAGQKNVNGTGNSFLGYAAGSETNSGSANTVLGREAGNANITGSSNTIIGENADVSVGDLTNATAIGSRTLVSQSNSLVLGSINGVNGASASVNVGIGTTAPTFKLQVVDSLNTGLRVQTNSAGGTVASFGSLGNFQIDAPGVAAGRFVVTENGFVGIGTATPSDRLVVGGFIRFSLLGTAGSGTLCRNSLFQISGCSSSLRYKTNIAGFSSGLKLVGRLRPVTFDWKETKAHDLGLVAEEVAEVEPLLVTHNDKGEIEGVKYDRFSAVLINAIKEQQSQIESLQKENLEMKARLAALERLMLQSPQAGRVSEDRK